MGFIIVWRHFYEKGTDDPKDKRDVFFRRFENDGDVRVWQFGEENAIVFRSERRVRAMVAGMKNSDVDKYRVKQVDPVPTRRKANGKS